MHFEPSRFFVSLELLFDFVQAERTLTSKKPAKLIQLLGCFGAKVLPCSFWWQVSTAFIVKKQQAVYFDIQDVISGISGGKN